MARAALATLSALAMWLGARSITRLAFACVAAGLHSRSAQQSNPICLFSASQCLAAVCGGCETCLEAAVAPNAPRASAALPAVELVVLLMTTATTLADVLGSQDVCALVASQLTLKDLWVSLDAASAAPQGCLTEPACCRSSR